MLHMLEDLQRERNVIRQAKRDWLDTVDAVHDPMLVHDTEFRIVRANAAYAARAGMAFSDLIGRRYWECFPRRAGPLPACGSCFAPEHPATGAVVPEDEFVLETGESFVSHIFPGREIDGRRGYSVHVFEDTTERRRAREAVERSERYYRKLIEGSADAFFVIDQFGTLIYRSESGKQLTGYDSAEVVGKPITAYLAPASQPLAMRTIAEAMRHPDCRSEVELRLIRKDGTELDVEAVGRNYLDDPDVRGIVVTVRDITARKQSTEKIQASEHRYSSLFENMLEGYAYCRILFEANRPVDFAYVAVNPAFEPLTTLRDVVGKKASELISGIHDTNPEILSTYARVASSRKPETFQTYIQSLDVWLSITAYAAEKDHFIAVFDNITTRKRAEDEIRSYLARLEQAMQSTINVVATIGELRDPYTHGHERRVGEIAAAIAEEMGMDGNQVEGIRIAGYLHDVGKIGVPAEILVKPARLTEAEFDLVKDHAQQSYEILKTVPFPWPVAEAAWQHHERLDGNGYPRGLKGDEIIREARVLAVADVVEAMSSHRPYRPGLGIDKALAEIESNRGKLYDPQAVDACLRLFREKGYTLSA